MRNLPAGCTQINGHPDGECPSDCDPWQPECGNGIQEPGETDDGAPTRLGLCALPPWSPD